MSDTTDLPGADAPIAARVGSGEAQYPVAPSLLDAGRYRDPRRYERELERIFHRSWLPVARSVDLAQPRDHVVWDRFGQSVVITRLDDGAPAAWHNVCQHRGARLVRGSGRCPTGSFKCPWHGFAYDLEGKLVHAPLAEAFDPAELDGLRTPQVLVREWSGLVWVALTPDVPSFETYLGELHGELGGYGFGGWTFRYADAWPIAANWKTVIDAFNETWHVPFTHKNTVKGGLLWRDAALRIMPPHSMLALPVRRYVEKHGGIDREGDHRETMLCHYLAFPNTIFNCFPTHAQVFSAWPVGPRETVLSAWGALAPAPEGWSEDDWLALGDKGWANFCEVAQEDVEVLEDAGRIYDSLGFRRNMFNSAEGRLTAFHAEVDARAGEGPA